MASLWNILKSTAIDWVKDDAPRLGAALAFYAMLSLGPLLLLLLSGLALLFGDDAARGQMMGQIDGMIGQEGAAVIQQVLASAESQETGGVLATLIGVVMLMVGASGVFGQLQHALNTIWNVPTDEHRGIWRMVKGRFFSFAMVMGSGFLLLVSLFVSAGLAVMGEFAHAMLPGSEWVLQLVNQLVGLGVITALFALIFKYVPDVHVRWKDVWAGAALTAVLFTVGKLAIGLYLGHSAFSSTWGAAGSLVVVLVWVYYSAQILFFGAEFTQQVAARCRGKEKPCHRGEETPPSHRCSYGVISSTHGAVSVIDTGCLLHPWRIDRLCITLHP